MAAPEGTKQVTLFVNAELLEAADKAAKETYNRNNARTAWISEAIREKLENDARAAEGVSDPAEKSRVREIVNAYAAMNETGKEWLHLTACIARGADDFKA